ncbi:hypothetical protein F9U64_07295 [Gracilibacillus oryzae]|uniref:Uncharacterized protein n=1 Tax=Gracilibacillus oryzae TaxID=1672701 RepID=A0A7C8GUX5_9BACI|nr:hypothetical protein [Gracilibacillus oryzae]KAB8137912.1 hypothetical protein F9U64_07295 [Gracilibacillus oryzae]
MQRIVALTLLFLIIFIPVHLTENTLTEQTVKITVAKDVQDNEFNPVNSGSDKFVNFYLPIIIILIAAIKYYRTHTYNQPLQRKLLARFYQSNYLVPVSLK